MFQPSGDPLYETIQIGPPFRGLIAPYKGIFNPYEHAGRATTFNNWRLRNDVLQLVDGYAEISGLTVSGQVKMLASYKSSARNDLIYVDGQTLKYWDLDAGSGGSVATIMSTSYARRVAFVRFRNRFLLATYADGLWWYDAENRTSRQAGNAAPSSAVTLGDGGAGALTGTYSGWASFVNDQGHESQLYSGAGTVTITSKQIAWSNIPTGPTGTSYRRLYRTTSGGALPLFLTTIAGNVTTTYTDNNADATLGAEHQGDFTVPPTTIRNIAASATRVYLVDTDGKTVWASKIDSDTGLPNWEAFPSSLSVQYPFVGGQDTAMAVTPIGQVIFVWGNLGGFRTLGDIATSSYTEPLPWPIGFFSPFSYTLTSDGLMFVDNEKKLRLFNASAAPKEIGDTVTSLTDGMLTSAGLDGPDMAYDAPSKCVYLNYGITASSANTKTLLYFLDKNESSTADWAFETSYYSHTDKKVYASVGSGTKLYAASGYKANGTNFSGQSIEFLPITPISGDKSYFVRLVLAAKAQPLISGVVPMLKVEWAFDDSGYYESKYVDVSKDYLVYKAGDANVKRIIEIPLYKRAESIAIKITPANNSASVTNGQEIYSIHLHWRPSAEAKMSRRNIGANGRVQSS